MVKILWTLKLNREVKTHSKARDSSSEVDFPVVAEAVELDLEPLAAVTGTREAIEADAPLVWDEVPGNIFVETFFGDEAACDAAFAGAAHVVRASFDIARVTGVPLEVGSAYPKNAKGSPGSFRKKREHRGPSRAHQDPGGPF